MIKNTELLSMAQVTAYLKEDKGSETDVVGFIKKFTKLSIKNAEELKKKLQDLDLMKVNEKHIVKIIDLLPENKEELNKIFTDVSLDEDEQKQILETVREFK